MPKYLLDEDSEADRAKCVTLDFETPSTKDKALFNSVHHFFIVSVSVSKIPSSVQSDY